METIEISKSEYDALQARPTSEQLETARAERDRAVTAQEASDAENVQLRQSNETKDAELARFAEVASQATLRDERIGKLGTKFNAALGETTKARLKTQAATMQDAEWAERLAELAELVKVQPDEQIDPAAAPAATETAGAGAPAPGSGTPTFTQEEVARQQVRGDLASAPVESTVGRSVIAGLVRRPSTKAGK